MNFLNVSSVILTLTAVFLYLNGRFIRWPNVLGLMAFSMLFAIILASLELFGFEVVGILAADFVSSINLTDSVLNGFLCLLLFVGALHVDIDRLWKEKVSVSLLATLGVAGSAGIVGLSLYLLAPLCGVSIPFIYCLIFGTLIAPTDAVMTLAFLKDSDLPESLESTITGESLLNDGMSIVLFLTLVALASGFETPSLTSTSLSIVWEILGAALFGLVAGYLTHIFIKMSENNNPYLSIVATLALATGSYAGAVALGASGPIASVTAGLLIGNKGHVLHEDNHTILNLNLFWDLIEEILNAILFVIIGLELLALSTNFVHNLVGLVTIPSVIVARYITIRLIYRLLRYTKSEAVRLSRILTWGGIRGGVSIALVLSLPAGEVRDVLMTATYMVVIFSVFVLGPSLSRMVKKM